MEAHTADSECKGTGGKENRDPRRQPIHSEHSMCSGPQSVHFTEEQGESVNTMHRLFLV